MAANANQRKAAREQAFDKSVLFEDHREIVDVDLPPYGTFRVRGLSRAETLALGEANGAAEIEATLIHLGCIDPQLTKKEVQKWQSVAVGMALEPLSDTIGRLSGLNEEAERETVKEFPGES